MLFPTTLVGSYPQPDWLIDRAEARRAASRRACGRSELWRVPEPWLAEAQDDATLLAIRAQEEAGLDIITDGEIRRESYSNRFATALEGVDLDNPGTALDRSGPPEPGAAHRRPDPAPARRSRSTTCSSCARTRAKPIKMTVPGPFTMSQQAQNDYYPTEEAAAMAYAAAVNEEIRDLFAAGADIVQIDEPYMQAQPEKARAVRAAGAQPRARGRHRHDRRAHLLRLRRDRPPAPVGLLVPARAGRLLLPAGLDRDGAVRTSTARCWRKLAGKQIMVGLPRPQRHDGRDAGDRRRAHPARAAPTCRPST